MYDYEGNSSGNNSDYVYYRYIDDMVVFYSNDSNVASLATQYPKQLALGQGDMIDGVMDFLDLKITLYNKDKLIFDIFDGGAQFSF